MLYEWISEIVFMIQCQLQGLKLWPFMWFIFNFTFLLLLFYFKGLQHISLHAQLCTIMHEIWWWWILCTARLSLCYTATCYGIDECIESCWCMGDSKCNDPILPIPAEHTQIQWRQLFLVCCFREDYNIMACRVCINRRQSHYPNWFSPFTCV